MSRSRAAILTIVIDDDLRMIFEINLVIVTSIKCQKAVREAHYRWF